MALEQAGIDRNEQREIGKRTAVRQEQFLHDGIKGSRASRRQMGCWTRGLDHVLAKTVPAGIDLCVL
jgi:hypothetical protein